MGENALSNLFEKFNEVGVRYCVRGRYEQLPESLDWGDVDLLVDRKNFGLALEIMREIGFLFYPFTSPNLFYYFYSKQFSSFF